MIWNGMSIGSILRISKECYADQRKKDLLTLLWVVNRTPVYDCWTGACKWYGGMVGWRLAGQRYWYRILGECDRVPDPCAAPLFARGIRGRGCVPVEHIPVVSLSRNGGAVRGQPPRTAPKECPVYYTAGNVDPCLTGPSAARQP